MTTVNRVTSIRPARREDAQTIAHISVRSWQAAYHGLLSPGFLAGLEQGLERRAAYFERAIASGAPSVQVAESDGHVVGFCSFGASRDEQALPTTAELMAIYLLPQAWGWGLGSQLWEAAHRVLQVEGFAVVTVWVLDGNARAIRFYRRLGFSPDASSQRTFEENSEPLPLTRFALLLTPGA